ncbi:MAG: hypothetical protein ABIW82_15275 [Dokdonella sp.]
MNLRALFSSKPGRYWFETLLALAAVCPLFCLGYLRHTYRRDMPIEARPELGRTIAMTVNHGRIVYVTAAEQIALIRAYVFTAVGFGVAGVYAIIRASWPWLSQSG